MSGFIVVIPYDRRARRYRARMHPSLRRLQWIVGGSIEAVPHWTSFQGTDCVAYCNEEGKLEHLPINHVATAAWHHQAGLLSHPDWLCGHVVVIVGLPEKTRPEWAEED